MLQFLYTGRFNSLIDEVDECVRIANQCRLPDLSDRLQEANKRITSFGTKEIFMTHSPFLAICLSIYNLPAKSWRSGGFAAVICAIFPIRHLTINTTAQLKSTSQNYITCTVSVCIQRVHHH